MPPGLAERLTWFAIAVGVGVMWAFGSTYIGRPLELHAHAVFGALFTFSLGAGGWDVRGWSRWRQDVRYVMTQMEVPPDRRDDLRALITAIGSRDPDAARALREAVDRAR